MLITNIYVSNIHGASGAIAPGASSDEPDEVAKVLIERGQAVEAEVSDEDFFDEASEEEEEETDSSESIEL